ncbi:MAG: paraquat-inducible protein A [Syntrophaceae bacterium]|nr:paraquat-inducible protein A [Syntrophaceae bacterium]
MKKLMAIFGVLLIVGMILSAVASYNMSKEYVLINQEIFQQSTASGKITRVFSSKHFNELQGLADQVYYHVLYTGLSFFALAFAFIGCAVYVKNKPMICGAILIVSFLALVTGLVTPIFSVAFHKTFPVIGRIGLRAEFVGIVSAIGTWWSTGHYFVSLIVVVFSFTVPLAKTMAIGYVIAFPDKPSSARMLKIFEFIGGWSMLDVFIVAVTIVVVTINGKESTHAEIQIGLYYFFAYVILSMVSTKLFLKHLKPILL